MKLERRTTVITEGKDTKVITDKGELGLESGTVKGVTDQDFAAAQKTIDVNKKAAEDNIKNSGILKAAEDTVKDLENQHKTPAPKTPKLKPYTEAIKCRDRKEVGKLMKESREAGRYAKIRKCTEEGYRYIFEDYIIEKAECEYVCHSDEDANNENASFPTEVEAVEYAKSHPEIVCVFKVCGNEEEKVWEKQEEGLCPKCGKKPCVCESHESGELNERIIEDGGWKLDSSKAWEAWEEFKEFVGEDKAGEELAQALDYDTLAEMLVFLFRQHDFHANCLEEGFESGHMNEAFESGEIKEGLESGELREGFESGFVMESGEVFTPVESGSVVVPSQTVIGEDDLVDIDNIETFEPTGETEIKTFTSIKDAGDGAMFAFKDTLRDLFNLKLKVSDLQKLLSDSSDWLLNLLGIAKEPVGPEIASDELPVDVVPQPVDDGFNDPEPVMDSDIMKLDGFDDPEPIDYDEDKDDIVVGE